MREPVVDWRSLSPVERERQFSPRLAVPDADQWLAAWAARSAELDPDLGGVRDIRYGPGPKQTFDVFAPTEPAPLIVFIHGGYWRALDKSDHGFVVDGLMRSGFGVVNVNYDLCPTVTLSELNRQIGSAIRQIASRGDALGVGGGRFFIMGHSAGAHAAVLAAADEKLAGYLKGVIAVSGIYDTQAVAEISVNEDVRMSTYEAHALNALAMKPDRNITIMCSVGALEPAAWIGQSIAYNAMAKIHSKDCTLDIVADCHHFSVLEASCDPARDAGQRIKAFVRDNA